MGSLELPDDCLWGASTARSLMNFSLGEELMPLAQIRAMIEIKRACATANAHLGKLKQERADLIVRAANQLLDGPYAEDHDLRKLFPLHVWQTGSGTQSNMNVNEVLASLANRLAESENIQLDKPIHPNDDVNASQSSNDVFPTAMHIACKRAFPALLSALEHMLDTLEALEDRFEDRYKVARTHLQDAVPMRFSQEVAGWRGSLAFDMDELIKAEFELGQLPLGGTAVGTGLNTPSDWQHTVTGLLKEQTQLPLYPSENCFADMSSKNRLANFHAALRLLSEDLMKTANDIRWLASGPRTGLGELILPANEPGSSIMPGKVNPTQCEAICMIACQVMGNDVCISTAASQGNFQLNVYMPVMIHNLLQSVRLLTDGVNSFNERCLKGLEVNHKRMDDNLARSLMLVTKLAPELGYERCAELAKRALNEDLSLRELVTGQGLLSEADYDRLMDPSGMVGEQPI